MKTLRLFSILLVSILIFYSCRKDSSVPPSSNPKIPLKIEDLTVKSSFDWKTTVKNTFALTSKSSHSVVFTTPSGGVNRKFFLTADTPFTVSLSFPAYEKSIHLLFNGRDVELPLNGTVLSYVFNY
jgi:hypothetical protein